MTKKESSSPIDARVVLPKLHPGQDRVLSDPARYRVVMCGRRWGKTKAGIRWACDGLIAGESVGWFTPTYKYASEPWQEILKRLFPLLLRKDESERRIEFTTGGVFDLWTMDSDDPGRSRKYHRAIIDEAGLQPNLQAIWQQSIRPTLTDYRGRLLALGTPKGRRHGFIQMFAWGEDDLKPAWKSFRAPTIENPYMSPEEIAEAQTELPPEVFDQEYRGIPLDDGVNPFGLDKIAIAFEKGVHAPLGPVVVWGVDLARSVDFTVAVGMDAYRRVVKVERWQDAWFGTKERLKHLLGSTPAVVDATGVGDAIVSDLQGAGMMVTGYIFTAPSKLQLMQRLITAFQSEQLSIPEGVEWLRNELQAFEFEYTASGIRYQAPRGQHDDGVMALALALHGWDRVQGVVPELADPYILFGDDPFVSETASLPHSVGDFTQQLPEGAW
jgi:hypothetical protein